MRVLGLGLRAWLVVIFFAGMGFGSPQAFSAQDWRCDVDDFVTKAIGIEEPWLENSGYLYAQASRDNPSTLTLAPEIEGRLSDRLGLELDLPEYNADFPLGRRAGAWGPTAAGLKFGLLHECQPSQGTATLVTVELEGQYSPQSLGGEGNSVSPQIMWAQLWYPWFTQGEAGYTQQVGHGVTNGWFFNTSLGRAIHGVYAVQLEVEGDNQWVMPDGQRGVEGYVMPQVAYHASPRWLIAIGEQAGRQQGVSQTHWSTWGMLEREF
ncbi:hypothetical protein [Halothiobacillus sp. DCM-1]|uniref:hypothetical protein n=1 Tax=Halothiobacillus sp. DCM-1 TaxID=3112558 RepID=UPI003247DFC3